MQRLQAFKYELRPNGERRRHMGRFAGSRRFVYNKALALQKAHYEAGGTFIGYVAMAKLLTEWRHSAQTPWLKDAPVHPLQHALKDLECAYRNFFAQRARFPRFKRKGRSESFRYPDAKQFQVDQVNSRIKLPKLGWVRYRNSREVLGVPRNITLSASGGKWYASIQTVREVEQPVARHVGERLDAGARDDLQRLRHVDVGRLQELLAERDVELGELRVADQRVIDRAPT